MGDVFARSSPTMCSRLERQAFGQCRAGGVRARRSASAAAGAVAGANYGAVELHPWTSTVRPARTTTSSNKLDVPGSMSMRPRWRWEVADRGGLTRLDYTQNEINKTLVAPFSVRPAAGAPVSVLIASDELDDPALAPDRWAMATVGARIARHGDPLAPLIGLQQRLLAL